MTLIYLKSGKRLVKKCKHHFSYMTGGYWARNRMLVFATDKGLRNLCCAGTWYMDGTFLSAPRLFYQLYTIYAPIGEIAFTCVYAFLSGKRSGNIWGTFQIHFVELWRAWFFSWSNYCDYKHLTGCHSISWKCIWWTNEMSWVLLPLILIWSS